MTVTTLAQWAAFYQQQPQKLESAYQQLLTALSPPDNAWIYIASAAEIGAQLTTLMQEINSGAKSPADFPLFGVPCAVKDNIDVAGMPTSAACPAFTRVAVQDATVIARLKAAGAIVVGKTNLDQFATGLVGTRSPFGAVANSFNPDYISGGSSAGSASVVARGLVCFALGTDTAGSGRVPAGFNNIVGLKPTKGWLSTDGVVPASRLNDCVSVFALTVEDAGLVVGIAAGEDPRDPYSRRNPHTAPARFRETPRFAIPAEPEFFGDSQSEDAFNQALARLKALGAQLIPIDFSAFNALAEQLYYGAWVAERTVAVEDIFTRQPEAMDPTVRGIVANGLNYSACDAWKAEYTRAQLAQRINQQLSEFDALVVPTAPTIYTIADISAEPVRYNSRLGTYTNFTNLADLCALALPADFRADGLPAGITLIAPAWHDRALSHFGACWQAALDLPLGATALTLPPSRPETPMPGYVRVAVVGAHLRTMPLNYQLTTRNAVFIEQTRTAGDYRLYALANTQPPKPGLVRAAAGQPIIVELWDIPLARFGEFVAEIPAPLGIGTLSLEDGRSVKGFICEPLAINDATDITTYGGWKAWLTRPDNA